jgi:hypothetical protein
MQIGIFEEDQTTLYKLMYELSKELGFDLVKVGSIDDQAMGKIDGIVVSEGFRSSKDIAKTLKLFKNILLLAPSYASKILTNELAILCEEAGVDLLVAGPDFHPAIFSFISTHLSTPYYIRVIRENSKAEPLDFDTLYRMLYWNAFFSEGDFRKFKINVSPAVSDLGVLIFGKTESALSIPVEIWFTNLGFSDVEFLKIFSQTEVLELDCRNSTFMAKSNDGDTIENYQTVVDSASTCYIRSFVDMLKGKSDQPLNIPLPKFLRLVEFYNTILQSQKL